MKLKSVLIAVIFALGASSLLHAQAPTAQFRTPLAVNAKLRYDQLITVANQQYLRELDAAMKAAMQFSNLEEANVIAAVSKAIAASGSGDGDFKTAPAKAAKTRYTQAVTIAKKQYFRELEGAGKSAMTTSNLEEANAINATRSHLDEELKSLGAGLGVVAFGLGAQNNATKPGLLVKEYPYQKEQTSKNAYVPVENMGEQAGKAFTIRSLFDWKYNQERNAVASGFLKIEKDGEYAFRSNNAYDRNMLMVDGQVVCKYADGETTVSTIELKKGMVPIISVGFVYGKGSVKVSWKPPGQAELGEIPGKLLFH